MNNPVWIDERGKIIEPEYCRDFLSRHPMRCKQNTNHHSVIYRMVIVVCGKVTIFTVSLASPPNRKVDGVLFWTVLHGLSPE